MHQTHIPGLDVVPSNILLSNTDIELTIARDHREARLKTPLDAIQHDCDHVTIDCPPAPPNDIITVTIVKVGHRRDVYR
jgi:cellulose biosynthesis protein BcsQ